ncbi:Sec20 [Kalmanozyma brasiliensis GHG001]|uniref:Sec20 C-terminal domain-containing protein n=1 Tax=Kalmanozyma brasiliensis (strain GHG001) TaxID=1365824 RepID=V5ESW9_KALBG|nr:Sec20 [Kalmanozyma brasiliensis GHG001]EST08330.1 Sec20 [Kalmanozyma brasiliensis GHG001]
MASATASSSRSPIPPDLVAVHASFQRYGQDVITHQIPRLQSCKSASLLTDYEAEIISSIDGLKRQVTDLKFAVDEAESDAERREIASLAASSSQQLEEIRQLTRKSLLAARRSIESARTADARAGLQLAADNAKERTGGRPGSSGEDKLMTASQDVTDALRRTVSLMSSELEKSAMSSQLLEESSQTLSSLSFQYGSLTTLMTNSAKMIKTMEREDLIGKGMVALSMLFFLGCVGWIVYVRLISKGIGLVGWMFRLFGLDKLLGGMAGRGGEDVKEKAGLLKETAKEVLSSKIIADAATAVTAAVTAITSAVSAATAGAAAQTGSAKQRVEEKVMDLQDDLEQLTETVMQQRPAVDEAKLPKTRQNTLPVEHVEL